MDYIIEGITGAFRLFWTLDSDTFSVIFTTLKVTTGSMAGTLFMGLPIGFVLGYYPFRGKKEIRVLVDTLLCLPTVFIGLMVYALISRHGLLGSYGFLFSLRGIALGQMILALPIVISLTATAIENMDRQLSMTLISLGANQKQLLLSTLWETRSGILSAGLIAYGRVMTEVGISMMVGGNIKYYTRTITTAIALETNKGEFAMGIALGLVLMVIALSVNLSVSFLRRH